MDRAVVLAFLAGRRYAVVSSVGEAGTPQSALVGFAATPELDIVFDTVTYSRKYANLVARPACSVVVGLGEEGEEAERTVQIEGRAFVPGGDELERYQRLYFAVWPECRAHLAWAGIVYVVVRPEWVRWSDYGVVPAVVVEE